MLPSGCVTIVLGAEATGAAIISMAETMDELIKGIYAWQRANII